MPYIPREQRAVLDQTLDELTSEIRSLPIEKQDGAVNYAITRIVICVYDMKVQPNYYRLNRALGVLEAAKLEAYRRIIGPYEDGAANRNGDL